VVGMLTLQDFGFVAPIGAALWILVVSIMLAVRAGKAAPATA